MVVCFDILNDLECTKLRFEPPELCSKEDIWGPSTVAKEFQLIPILGCPNEFNFKVADSFLGDIPDKRATYRNEHGHDHGGDNIFGGNVQRGANIKKRTTTYQPQVRKDPQVGDAYQTADVTRYTKKTSKKTKLEQKSKEKNMFATKKKTNNRKNDVRIRRMYSRLEASLKVASNWEKIIELEFPFLSKLKFTDEISEVTDLCFSGSVGLLDPSIDRINSKKPIILVPNTKPYSSQSLILDPIIQNFSEEKTANVFATDLALTFLMCSPRSTSTWDVQVLKWENVIYIFTQMNPYKTPIDETFNLPMDVPFENTGINSVHGLYDESFRVQWAFRSQVVLKSGGRAFSSDDASEDSEAYRYRKFTIDQDNSIVVRFQLDGVNSLTSNKLNSKLSHSLVKTVLEWRPSLEMNWRQLIDTHKPYIVMNSIACNTCSVARWALTAKLGGFNSVKFGMISRKNMKSASDHVILGTHQLEVDELCGQISLNTGNCWAILNCVLKLFSGYEDGLYQIIKDPNKSSIFVYKRPQEDLVTINS